MVCGSFLIAAAALKTPARNGDNAQGVNLTIRVRVGVGVGVRVRAKVGVRDRIRARG